MVTTRSVVDVTYSDEQQQPRTGERVRDRRAVQEIPFEDVDDVRNRELALVRVPPRVQQELSRPRYLDDDYEVDQALSRRVRERVPESDYLVPYSRDRDVAYYDRRSSQRRSDNYDDEDEDSSRERRRRRRRRRARGERDVEREKSAKGEENANSEDEGRLWYSMKKRCDGSFVERHFDSSYDGLIAGAAGAAIGAMTARRFGGDEKKGLKALGGAVLGAVAFNAVENRYRVYTEEREERREEREEEAAERNAAQRQ
jgi:hypothetical protein